MLQRDYAYRISPDSISVHCLPDSPHPGACYTWQKSDPRYEQVLDLIRSVATAADIYPLMNKVEFVASAFAEHADITVTRDGVFYKGKPIHNTLTDRIMHFIELQLDAGPLVNFMAKLYQNHRREAVLSLFDFLERNNVPITEEGNFVAYKKVRSDYLDCHSGTIDNHPGQEPSVDPWEVDPDRDNACSNGLHVCSKEYLPHFGNGAGDRVVVVEVSPAHVVAVPRDYNCAKMRVFRYKVIGELADLDVGIHHLESSPLAVPGAALEGVVWHNDPLTTSRAYDEDDDDDGPNYDDDEDEGDDGYDEGWPDDGYHGS